MNACRFPSCRACITTRIPSSEPLSSPLCRLCFVLYDISPQVPWAQLESYCTLRTWGTSAVKCPRVFRIFNFNNVIVDTLVRGSAFRLAALTTYILPQHTSHLTSDLSDGFDSVHHSYRRHRKLPPKCGPWTSRWIYLSLGATSLVPCQS